MKGLFLSGYGCKPWIWEKIKEDEMFHNKNIEFVEWPMDLTGGFCSLNEFSTWVKDNFIDENDIYDFIIGHSMGGLVALQLSTMDGINVKHIVLVESYITSPGKFFQNILMDNTDAAVKEKVLNMLREESRHYSPSLGNQLKNLDLTCLIKRTKSDIHCIYGDRGINSNERVINELGLPENILENLDIRIIRNSCHFPMIENSQELLDALRSIFDNSN